MSLDPEELREIQLRNRILLYVCGGMILFMGAVSAALPYLE